MVDFNILDLGVWLDNIILLFKLYIGVMVGTVLIALIVILQLAFGFSIPTLAQNVLTFMFEGMKSVWLGIISTFHFDNKKQIFALSIIAFVLMIFIFMAFNVNQMGTASGAATGAGGISIGSDAVRGSSSGEGAKSGSGGWLGGGSTTPTTMGGGGGGTTQTTVTTITLPEFPQSCYNGGKDGDETAIDCGGSCAPCECFATNGTTSSPRVCGSNCPDKCNCAPAGTSSQCQQGYCCPSTNTVAEECKNMCAMSTETARTVFTDTEGFEKCVAGSCVLTRDWWVTLQQSVVTESDSLDWLLP